MNDIWFLAALSVALVVAVMLLAGRLRSRAAGTTGDAPEYERIDKLMSEAERALFAVLVEIAGSEFQVFGKVRIADVLAPSPQLGAPARRAALNRIVSRHFDYVICAATDLRILCVVELDDRSHARRDRRERDAFVDLACAASGLPLVRIRAAAQYSPAAVSEQIGAAIRATGT